MAVGRSFWSGKASARRRRKMCYFREAYAFRSSGWCEEESGLHMGSHLGVHDGNTCVSGATGRSARFAT